MNQADLAAELAFQARIVSAITASEVTGVDALDPIGLERLRANARGKQEEFFLSCFEDTWKLERALARQRCEPGLRPSDLAGIRSRFQWEGVPAALARRGACDAVVDMAKFEAAIYFVVNNPPCRPTSKEFDGCRVQRAPNARFLSLRNDPRQLRTAAEQEDPTLPLGAPTDVLVYRAPRSSYRVAFLGPRLAEFFQSNTDEAPTAPGAVGVVRHLYKSGAIIPVGAVSGGP